jgi:capsular exopolysaccharide synthesis family protein
MELREYARLLRKWLWLIVLCAVIAGGIVYFVSRRSTPIYEASATLMVNQASSPTAVTAYADILTSERLARTYASLLTSRPVIEATAARLGIDPTNLVRSVDVTAVRDTQLLRIQVQDPSPAQSAALANTLAQVFIERTQEMQQGRVSQSRANLEQEIANTEADIARTQTALAAAQDDTEKTRLETSLAQYRTTYSNLVASYQQVRLAEAQATDSVVIAESAEAPEQPVRPRPVTNAALAAIVGALLALGVAFLIEYLDDTIKTPDDVDRVTGLSMLGAIARLKTVSATPSLVASRAASAPESEAYRTLRTNIQFSSVDKPIRTLLVTSSSPGEGKSTTAANLAAVMAQTDQRVVVVDTDLRRPVLHKVFGVPNNRGLTSVLLAGRSPMMDDGDVQATNIDCLYVLPSGPVPPNPSELLGSHRMAELIGFLAERFDLVIFDSPPVLAVTDAVVLGRQMDGVLLVVHAGRTREHALAAAFGELRKTGAHVLGVALNRLSSRPGGYYHAYYYHSQDHTAEAGNGQRARLPWQRKPA